MPNLSNRRRTASSIVGVMLAFVAIWSAARQPACADPASSYTPRTMHGWKVYVHQRLLKDLPEITQQALELLEEQLEYIEQHVPAPAVKELRKVPLWFSPQYEGERARAEYHPNAGWLRSHGRPDAMEKCVEFTNIPIFAKEVKRMPVFVLHELAHAYHDRVLGWRQPEIEAAYQAAVASKKYDRVKRGNGRIERAYAMTDSHEYFAETTEAFFGENDFYPFNRKQLQAFDPVMHDLLARLWHVSLPPRATDPAPLALHPQNRHYFLWHGKPTILITSGEHYGALLNGAFDFRAYLRELKRHGLNHTRTFSGTYREIATSFGITDNPLAPKTEHYIAPWKRSDTPGAADGGNKFDLSQWNPAYFARLRSFLTAARQAGVVVEFNLFCPFYRDELWAVNPMNAVNNVNGIGNCPRTQVYTLRHRDLLDLHLRTTRRLVEALSEFDHVYIEVCNEPYFGGVSDAWQRRIIDEIVATERKLGRRHLISLNIANGRKKVENPPDEVSIFNFHYCVPPDTVALNYHLNKAIGENETGFRGQADVLYRTEGWDFILAGGAIYNNLDYSFTPKTPDGSLTDYRSPGGGSVALRKQLGILKRFINSFDFIRMAPDDTVVVKTTGDWSHQALSERGKQYAIYLHTPLPHKPGDLKKLLRSNRTTTMTLRLPRGRYAIEWHDPVSGKIVRRESLRHEGSMVRLTSPQFDNDIAMRITAISTAP